MAVAQRFHVVLLLLVCACASYASAHTERQSLPVSPAYVATNPFKVHPTNVTECENADEIDEDLLKCYTIDEETGDCNPEASEVDPSDRCDCADELHDESIINYFWLHYCALGSVKWLSIILMSLWAIFLFYIMGVATERYLVPVLNDLSGAMKLSHNVAGVTLLALANGAPDVFTSIAAFTSSGTANLGLGSLLGTGMFLATFTFGWVAHVNEFTAHRRPLLRDFLFYAGGIGLLYYCYVEREVQLWHALLFVGIYVVYVLVVVIGRIIFQRHKRALNPFPSADDEEAENAEDTIASTHAHLHGGHVQADDAPLIGCESIGAPKRVEGISGHLRDITGWDDKGRLGRLMVPFEFPFLLAMRLTIPMVGADTWSRPYSALCVAIAPHLAVFAFEQSDVDIGPLNIHVWGLMVTPLLALITYWKTSDRLPESKAAYAAFAFLSFLMSFVWPFKIADELVDLLGMFGIIVNISGGMLGVTVVSIGNSIQDVFADITLAKDKPKMAAAGCIGGPVFNLLVGVGAAFLIKTAGDYPEPLKLASDKQAGFGFLSLAIAIGCGLLVLPLLFRFRVSRTYGKFLMAIYVVYLLIAILMEADVIAAL